MIKFYILTATATMGLLLGGCKLECKKAYKHEKKVVQVANTALSASRDAANIDSSCQFMQEQGFNILVKTGKFAERAAYRKFYYEEDRCVSGYWTVRCDYGGGRGYPRHPHYPYPPESGRCYDYYQCTRYETKVHKLDGFEDAMFVADGLRRVNTEINIACLKNTQGDKTAAMKGFANSNALIVGDIMAKINIALTKAGCSASEE